MAEPSGIESAIRELERGMTLVPAHKTVIVSDKYINEVLSFEFPEIF